MVKGSFDEQLGDNRELLKSQVKDHWEGEACGTRYGEDSDRRKWFREIAVQRYELEPYILDFARFPQADGKRVLEIGIGAGSDFINWCGHAVHATGVDLTEAAIELTRERLSLENISEDSYSLQTADAEALSFDDNSFDIVYSWGVLHHTPDTDKAYREALRVLKPGGVMRTMIYHVPSWTGLMLYLAHGLARGNPTLGLKEAIYRHLESPGTKSYTISEGHALAGSAGFTKVSVKTKLGPGDLLTIRPSRKYGGWLYKMAFALYPRPLVRLLGHRFGLYLLIDGRKPE